MDLDELNKLAQDIRVLYVEDNDVARKKTYKILNRIFDNIEVAQNGREGLSLFIKNKHDLIISDIIMNIMDGIEMAKSIKSINPDQHIIFISAYTEQHFLTDAIELGVDGFVFKPIERSKLYFILEKSIKQILISKENIEYKKNLERLVDERSNDLIIKNYELKEMIKEVKKGNRLKEEMEIAQKVQENFLPKKLPKSKSMNIATYFKATQYVGGDYYDLFYSKDDSINIIIADVSGHGVAPAITMSTFRGFCRSLLSLDLPFEEQVSLINDLICKDAKHNDFFITAFFIKYYEKTNEFKYIGAGHNEVLFYNTLDDELEKLKSTEIPLGIFPNKKYTPIQRKLNKDDLIILYTDGLIEAKNKKQEMFKLDNLIEIVKQSKELEVNEILVNIQTILEDFIDKEPLEDDTTILVTKFT